uniref:Reverse transcriptase domain-containing protein n=1 Tax=Bursaphelenchus xylophilus TaxID=6326 RepID=A0A1I7RM06_BURXY
MEDEKSTRVHCERETVKFCSISASNDLLAATVLDVHLMTFGIKNGCYNGVKVAIISVNGTGFGMNVCVVVLVVLLVSRVRCEVSYLDLNLDKLNDFWHRNAVMALLRVKANSLKRQLPSTERIVYDQCAREAQNPPTLAACVVGLLNSRDNQSQNYASPQKSTDLFSSMKSLFHEVFPSPTLGVATDDGKGKLNLNAENPSDNPPEIPIESQENEPDPDLVKIINDLRVEQQKQLTVFNKAKTREKRSLPPALSNLQKIRNYISTVEKCNKYANEVNNVNSEYFRRAGLKMEFSVKEPEKLGFLDEIVKMINDGMRNNSKISVLSPRLLPLFSGKRRPHLLSPNLFSFQPNDGVLSLPDIFKFKNSSRISISVAPKLDESTFMNAHLTAAQKEYRLEQDIRALAKYSQPKAPRRKKRERIDTTKLEAEEFTIGEGHHDLIIFHENNTVGNVAVTSWPLILEQNCSEKNCTGFQFSTAALFNSTTPPKQYIQRATPIRPVNTGDHVKLHDEHQSHGSKSSTSEESLKEHSKSESHHEKESKESEEEEDEELPKFETLKPFAFGAKVNKGVVLEGLTLSPFAFWSEILQPEALNFQVLSPRAFIPSILSPSALMARVLSPAAFRAEILSPRALHAWVLTPEALIAEVLSPKALEVRVLSPEALIIQILSPNALAPKILSPEALGVIVLSPSVLSPHILSSEKLMVEVLSPSILSGSEESKESKEGEEEKGSNEKEKHINDDNIEATKPYVQPPPHAYPLKPQFYQGNQPQDSNSHYTQPSGQAQQGTLIF